MIIYLFPILLFHINFVSTFGVLYDIGFKHLTEKLLQLATNVDLNIIKTEWITQKIDHFDEDSKTWSMRYFVNLEYFRPNGPIYIFLGGEGEANPGYLSTGVIRELAEESSGAMFMTEHRYYGKSIPFDKNVNVSNMKWLTCRQALADIANLIKSVKSSPPFTDSKVVVIGGSYAGNLAAWMRLKYSNLVDAAIASSGPVLAKKDFFEYLEKVNKDYELYGTTQCLDNVRNIFFNFEKMLQNSVDTEKLKNKLNICPYCDLTKKDNQWILFLYLTEKFMTNSQYGGPQQIKDHCSDLEAKMNTNYSNRILSKTQNNCLDVSFNTMIEIIKATPYVYSWSYQVCTEFGYFQTTSSNSQPFGKLLSLEYFLKLCSATYGPDFNEEKVNKGIDKTNECYGGLKPNVSHVVFVNGDMDPWSTISVLEDISYEAPAVVIPSATHCADLFPNVSDASTELKEASKYIKYLIKQWIGLGDENNKVIL